MRHDKPITEKRVITYEDDGYTVKSDTYVDNKNAITKY